MLRYQDLFLHLHFHATLTTLAYNYKKLGWAINIHVEMHTHYLHATLTRSSLALANYFPATLARSSLALASYLHATLARSSLALANMEKIKKGSY